MWDLRIDKDHKITSTEKQYQVKKVYQSLDKETGEKIERWKTVTSHTKLSDAVSALVERGVRCADVKTVADAVKASQEWIETLTRAFIPHGLEVSKRL